jgi:peptide/nickel transport system substrate-binding protein
MTIRSLIFTAAIVATAGSAWASDVPTRGGTIVYLNYEPQLLNPYMEPEAVAGMFGRLVSRGLTDRDEQGHWVPLLAQKVPDPKDGDVSADLLTVTWKLRPNLKWSDGTPLTSDDLRFTWEVCGNPKNGCAKNQGFVDITRVETPDPQTIVLHYKKLFFAYAGQFRQGVLPRHSKDVGTPSQVATWTWNRTMSPTDGPFTVVKWDAGQGMTLARNPYFYEPGKPYLDGIDVVFKNDPQTMFQALLAGEADMSTWLTIPAPEQLKEAKDRGFTFGNGDAPYLNTIQFNLRDPKDLAKPHPILGDVRVRRALMLGINVDDVIADWSVPGFNKVRRITSRADLEPGFECNMPPVRFDPAAAARMLDEAGWKLVDGVRQKNGVKMRLRVGTYTGFNLEPNIVVLQSQLRKLGIDARVENVDAQVLYSSWLGNSPMYRGDFDILFYDNARDLPGIQDDFEAFYASSSVASQSNPSGRNSSGIDDKQIDDWLSDAGRTLDPEKRKQLYCKIADRVQNGIAAQEYTATYTNWPLSQPKLKGWKQYEMMTWFGQGSENWYLAK